MCCANLAENGLACVSNLSYSMCCANLVKKWPCNCLCSTHGVHCLKRGPEGHVCPFLTFLWCAPTYVYAWHTYALAPFKTAKRVKVEEKKKRRLNLPEIVMQMIQKVERYSNVARVCVAP